MPSTPNPLRPTRLEVNLTHLAGNLHLIHQKVAPARVMPVVKANAYGHGLVEVARHMLANGADCLGVAILEEGILLREGGLTGPILVLGGFLPEQIPLYLTNDLQITASSLDKLLQIDEAARGMGRTARVHLKIDTGMGRLGVQYFDAEAFLETSLRCQHCLIEGIFSHFASSDEANLDYAHLQLERFNQVLSFYEKRGLQPPLRHMANSGAIIQLPESYFDMVRPGIMLYGVYPSDEVQRTVAVRPALTWKSQVVHSKILPPGHPVGYGSTWHSDHPVRLVTIPVGYADGYFRRMSGNARVILRGTPYPVVGRIAMDQVMVNMENDPADVGEEVTLLGEGDGESITCEDMAAWAGTNIYEILTNISARVPRVYTT